MSKRIEWIDIAKGLGIILVVVGHIVDYGKPLFIWIYSFHMALFFFISGVLFDPQKRINYKRLLKPGIVTLGFSILITLMIPEWREAVTLKGIIVSLYNGMFSQFHVTPIWFLFCLAWCETIMQIIFRYVSTERKWNVGISVVLLLSLLAVIVKKGFHFISKLTGVGLVFEPPMWIGTTILAMIFLFAGYEFKDYAKQFEPFSVSKLSAITAGFFVGGGLEAYFNGNVNLGGFTFNNMGLYLLESFSFLGGGITLSIVMNKLGTGNVLKWLGQRTLPILCIHVTLGDVLLYMWGRFDGNSYTMNLIENNLIKLGLFGVYVAIFMVWFIIDQHRTKVV